MQVRNCFRGCLQCTNVCLTHPIISGISEVLLALQKYFMRIFYKNTKNSFRALRSKFFPHQSQKGATVSLKICIAGIELWHKWNLLSALWSTLRRSSHSEVSMISLWHCVCFMECRAKLNVWDLPCKNSSLLRETLAESRCGSTDVSESSQQHQAAHPAPGQGTTASEGSCQ